MIGAALCLIGPVTRCFFVSEQVVSPGGAGPDSAAGSTRSAAARCSGFGGP